MKFDLRGGNETAQTADEGNKTALDNLSDTRLYAFAAVLDLFDFAPRSHVIGLDFRKCAAVLSAKRLNIDIDHVADFDDVLGGFGLRTGELALRNGNFLLVADIYDCFVVGYLHDRTLDHFMLADVVHAFDLLFEHRAHVFAFGVPVHIR